MMLASNQLRHEPILSTMDMLLAQATVLRERVGVDVGLLNIGGGIGVPYRPEERPFDLRRLVAGLRDRLAGWQARHGGRPPRLCLESGRYITGPHGVLVTRVVNRMTKWREFVGVDASMPALMRPALYPTAYHHITAPWATSGRTETVDVVGSLCEGNDRFGVRRQLPVLAEGDLVLIHDTGAHGHAMGFNYNGRLRPQELLLHPDGTVERIRRGETERDLFATLDFPADRLCAPTTRFAEAVA
jgi:diaminopimelate decarboxylase